MNSLLIKATKKKLSKSQEAFNRLVKKIEKTQKSIKETEAILNKGLSYYRLNVRSVEKTMLEKLSECVPIFYSYYKNPRSKLSKKEKEILKELIQSLLARLTNYLMPQEINEEITKIIKDIEGTSFKEIVESKLDCLKKEIRDCAERQGFDIDLSALDAADSQEELMSKFQKAIFESLENKKTEAIDATNGIKQKVKKKTARQLEKEQKEKEAEEIHKKGISKIYKQLARVLHPDLELDPILKSEKEELMKKLTVAYENQDLHTLLTLEITWMNREMSNGSVNYSQKAEEQLNVYNIMLKDQARSLQQELEDLFMHPRYFDIQHILNECHPYSILETLEETKNQLFIDFERYSLSIVDLKEGANFKRMKQILKEFSSESDVFEMIEFFL